MPYFTRFIATIIVIAGALLFMTALPAQAYYFQWKDPHSGMVVNIPDTWKRVINENVADSVTFRAPGQNQFAGCRMAAVADHRFAVYPEPVSDHVQNVYFDYGYWEQHALTQFKHFKVHTVEKGKGMGNGFATYADISYVPYGVPKHMRALLMASHYNNKTYVWECHAEASAFYPWYETFKTVLASVRFGKEIHELPGGNYRNFLDDKVLHINTINGQSSNH